MRRSAKRERRASRELIEHPASTARDPLALIPLDAVVLSLSLLAALYHPVGRSTSVGQTLIDVSVTFLLGLYWLIAVLGRRDGEYRRRGFQAQLFIVLAEITLVTVLPTVVAIGSQPFQERLTVPILVATKTTIGFFDERFILLCSLVLALAMVLALARAPAARLALIAGIGMNPFLRSTFITGQNDILVLTWLMGVILLARRGKTRSALLLLGTALAMQETAVLLAPFLLLWLAGEDGVTSVREAVRWAPRALAWIVLPLALLVGASIVGDAPALFERTVGFVEGTVPHLSPMRGPGGFGFATFILYGGFVRSSSSYWPFGIVQLLVAAPVTFGLLRRQWRDNTLARVVANDATVLFLVLYFGRSFHTSLIGYTLALYLVAFFMKGPGERSHISLDFLILLLVVPQIVPHPSDRASCIYAAITMILLVLYALVDARLDGWLEEASRRASAQNRRWRGVLFLALLLILIVFPETSAMAARQRPSSCPASYVHLHPTHGACTWTYVHDTPMQAEEAVKFLLAGKNFYSVTYTRTPMVYWYSSPTIAAALYHVDRPPLSILISVPFYLGRDGQPFDERVVLLPFLLLCVVVLLRLPLSMEIRLAALAGIVLNPFFVPTLIYGQDDVIVLGLLLLCASALYRSRYRRAALCLGLAIATKQTAVLFLPLFVIFIAAQDKEISPGGALRRAWSRGWPALVVPLLVCAPFIIWDARGFFAGTVGFLAGTVSHSYPIRGTGTYGFSAFVLLHHLVASPNAYYPFSLWEGLIGGPLLFVLGRRLWRAPSVHLLFAAYAIFLSAVYFFSRFFQDSGLAYAVSMLILGALLYAKAGADLEIEDSSIHEEQSEALPKVSGGAIAPVTGS